MKNKKSIISYIALPIFVITLIILAIIYRHQIWDFFKSKDAIVNWILSHGVLAPLFFSALMALQIIVFVIPGELVQFAGGYVFGLGFGILWTIVGVIVGAIIAFFLGRFLGKPFVESLFGKEKIMALDKIARSEKGLIGIILLFAIPGIPKDILYYFGGIANQGFFKFLILSLIARLPSLVGAAFIGSAASNESWLALIIVSALAIILLILGIIFKNQIMESIYNITSKTKKYEK